MSDIVLAVLSGGRIVHFLAIIDLIGFVLLVASLPLSLLDVWRRRADLARCARENAEAAVRAVGRPPRSEEERQKYHEELLAAGWTMESLGVYIMKPRNESSEEMCT